MKCLHCFMKTNKNKNFKKIYWFTGVYDFVMFSFEHILSSKFSASWKTVFCTLSSLCSSFTQGTKMFRVPGSDCAVIDLIPWRQAHENIKLWNIEIVGFFWSHRILHFIDGIYSICSFSSIYPQKILFAFHIAL